MGVTLALSVSLAVGFVLFLNFFDSRLYEIEDAEKSLGLPVLAVIPAVGAGSGHCRRFQHVEQLERLSRTADLYE